MNRNENDLACPHCENELTELDLDTAMCGECFTLFEYSEDGDELQFEGGETVHV